MVDGADMRSQKHSCWTTLTTDQFSELIAIIIEDHGTTLQRERFNDAMLILFEDIAGFELLTNSQRNRLLKTLWSRYQRSGSADQRH
jgi:hypothetical protein